MHAYIYAYLIHLNFTLTLSLNSTFEIIFTLPQLMKFNINNLYASLNLALILLFLEINHGP